MSGVPPLPPVSAALQPSIAPLQGALPVTAGESFSGLLMQGLMTMESKLAKADELVERFAIDDSIPVHQVTYALEEARLSVELAMQVRSRFLEAYRDLMNMQL